MPDEVIIKRRFRGPPESGNGGYSSGVFASFIDGPAEVTLRSPPPLDTPIAIDRSDGGVRALHGDVLVAEARPAHPDVDPVAAVSFEEAQAAAATHAYGADHPFPGCFVCGPARDPGDGLRIFGVPARSGVIAAPWIPAGDLGSDETGAIGTEFVWAALDCPSGFAAWLERDVACLLGRMTAEVRGPVYAGERYVVVGWPLGSDGRKLYAGSALLGPDGSARAVAKTTWIALS